MICPADFLPCTGDNSEACVRRCERGFQRVPAAIKSVRPDASEMTREQLIERVRAAELDEDDDSAFGLAAHLAGGIYGVNLSYVFAVAIADAFLRSPQLQWLRRIAYLRDIEEHPGCPSQLAEWISGASS